MTDEEREFFASRQVELAPSAKESGLMQRFYLYLMMTKPSRQLVVTYAACTGSGKELRPSSLIRELSELFPQGKAGEGTGKEKGISVPYSWQEAVDSLAKGLREWDGDWEEDQAKRLLELFSCLYGQPSFKELAVNLSQAFSYAYQERGIGRAAARALYGQVLEGSVTRLELYAACAYSHFLQYGLMLRERKEYSFEQVDLGNLYHGVLEVFAAKLSENHYTWFDFPPQEGDRLLKEALDSCAAAYGETILYSSARYEYMTERIYRILQRTIRTLQSQLRGGSFAPSHFEMSFSRVENLEAVKYCAVGRGEDEA